MVDATVDFGVGMTAVADGGGVAVVRLAAVGKAASVAARCVASGTWGAGVAVDAAVHAAVDVQKATNRKIV